MINENPILATWSSVAETSEVFPVMPDGCRDFIIKQNPGSPPHLFVSHLMSAPQKIFAPKGTTFIGVRLKPGASIKIHRLIGHPLPDSIQGLTELAYDAASMSGNVSDMMRCLALAASPATAAGDLGVSLRTLQRHTMKITGRTPDFWRRLSRARKAARSILSGAPLHEVAPTCNFSDQAHMTRELKCWFAMTPGEISASRDDSHHPVWSICHLGYDTP
ncbi:helix-turn-helix domain-containing protein [Maridesulfovibrio salexigens]|uniref:Transcriptional regulator, AraC family n=1 Tax=Maridesulfovibrio salexigens (strain ATCC 14822 / DSM 2638 / NCIMB 8403 / VKM B-1763) TaxID=526222 RepID=C6BXZ1_MARSD|nr:helix-turn-helix domain-containing protein [Maridesulfovibrio salexigens]ACS80521.1 transcriptional regulator, AraC family [Maridesulfovibrio salexigens DSM 2638]